ncbi:MAG: metallophosphoesterase [Akkermansiaceae bacterium]
MPKTKHKLFTRRNFIRTSLLTVASSYGYARWIEPNQLSVTRKELYLPHLPKSLDGLVIAQLTDIHFQPDSHEEMISEAVKTANAAQADMIVLTGDYITHSYDVFPPLMEILSKLKAEHGVYGIMGNHDGWHGRAYAFNKGFQKAGFDFLVNQSTRLEINGEKIHLLGTDSIWSGSVDAPACYRGHTTETVIALVHEPDVFDTLRQNYRVDLQLSGHTHGGQCRVPLIGYAPVKVRYGRNYIYGDYEAADSRIFVSRGLGTVGQSVRFACKPEVAILTLRSKLS